MMQGIIPKVLMKFAKGPYIERPQYLPVMGASSQKIHDF
jgi:hypothetical protein